MPLTMHQFPVLQDHYPGLIQDQAGALARTDEIFTLRRQGQPTVPTTIGKKKATNPLLRTKLLKLGKVDGSEDHGLFASIRAGKDHFRCEELDRYHR
jgi:hydroxyacylglutathione hydrolase